MAARTCGSPTNQRRAGEGGGENAAGKWKSAEGCGKFALLCQDVRPTSGLRDQAPELGLYFERLKVFRKSLLKKPYLQKQAARPQAVANPFEFLKHYNKI